MESFLLLFLQIDFRTKSKSTVNFDTVFPHIVSAETIVFWIWKSKGHST